MDIISIPTSKQHIYVDLRPGAHSYEGSKSSLITAAHQLTISHGSRIENVEAGLGNDTIIGNQLSNIIISGEGDDRVFAGEGMDIIYPGIGNDIIDLSEDVQTEDRIVFEKAGLGAEFDIVYGFAQGINGDVIDITDFNFLDLILPIVDILSVPYGYIDNCLVRVFGGDLDNEDSLNSSFNSGLLDELKLSIEASALIVTSPSQNTGDIQSVFVVENEFGSVEVHQLAK